MVGPVRGLARDQRATVGDGGVLGVVGGVHRIGEHHVVQREVVTDGTGIALCRNNAHGGLHLTGARGLEAGQGDVHG